MLNERVKAPMRDDKADTVFTVNTLNSELATIRRDLKQLFSSYYASFDGQEVIDAKVLDATLPLINEFITTETR